MKERGIIFTTELIPKILDLSKTQTRRVLKVQPDYPEQPDYWRKQRATMCPYGQVGSRLWCREVWATEKMFDSMPAGEIEETGIGTIPLWYKALDTQIDRQGQLRGRWRSSRFCPKWASRITLEITGIRVERLQEITFWDVEREGCPFKIDHSDPAKELHDGEIAIEWFRNTWNKLNAKWKRVYNRELKIYEFWQFPWCAEDAKPIPKTTKHPERYHYIPNPWVWVIEFKRLNPE